MLDLIIIGGGPAGISAAVYAARKQIKTAIIAYDIGGQSSVSADIQNWIGTVSISGTDLAKNLRAHLEVYTKSAKPFVELMERENVITVEKIGRHGDDVIFQVKTDKGEYRTRSILVATGGSRRKLDIIGSKEFENKGITYCASCDGPLFEGQDVAVLGGGNAGFETALQLLQYCKSVTLLTRGAYRADKITVAKVVANQKFKGLPNTLPLEILGGKFVERLVYQTEGEHDRNTMAVSGIFAEIGFVPATDFVKDLVELDTLGRIKINFQNQRSHTEGIWAAGDCTDTLYHQNNIAAGDAVRALEDIYLTL